MGGLEETEKMDSVVTDSLWEQGNSQVCDLGDWLGNGKPDYDSWMSSVGE